jgi:hypothetical protein
LPTYKWAPCRFTAGNGALDPIAPCARAKAISIANN